MRYFILLFICQILNAQVPDSLEYAKRKAILDGMGEIDSIQLLKMRERLLENRGKPHTTKFYEIFLDIEVEKKYRLAQRKYMTIGISNWGCKDFYIPEWLTVERKKYAELYIEIFKKDEKGGFVVYKSPVEADIQQMDAERKIISLKNREGYNFSHIELDLLNKIQETGFYKVKAYIDLSGFGYFKELTTTSFEFEVIK